MPMEMKILILVLLGAIAVDAGLLATQPQAVVAAAPAYVETAPQFLAAPAPAPLLATQAVQPAVVTHAQKTIAAAPAAVSLAQPLNYATFQYVPVATPAKVLSAPAPTYISAPRTLSSGPVQNRAPSPPREQRPPPPPPSPRTPPQPLPLSADEGRRSRKDDDDRRNPHITIILHAAAVAPRPAGLTYLAGAAQPQLLAAAPAVVPSVPHQEVLVQQPAVLSVEPGILTSYAPQVAVLGSSAQGAEGLQQSAGPAPPSRQPEPPRRQEPPPPPPPQLSAPRPSSYGQQQASYGASQGPALQSSGGGGAGGRLHHDSFARAYRLQEQRPQAAPEFSAAEAPAQPQQLSSGDAGGQQYGSGVSYSSAAQPVTNAVISGFYGFVDPLGVYQQVDYVNDQQGYRATTSSASDAGASQYAPEPAPTFSSQGMPQDQQYSGGATASGHSGVATAKAAVYPVHAPALRYKIYQ